MVVAVGISFKPAGRIYSFDPNGLELAAGEMVITETARGVEFGRVKHAAREVAAEQAASLKRVLRVATPEDRAQVEANGVKAEEALALCRQRVMSYALPMKLLR